MEIMEDLDADDGIVVFLKINLNRRWNREITKIGGMNENFKIKQE